MEHGQFTRGCMHRRQYPKLIKSSRDARVLLAKVKAPAGLATNRRSQSKEVETYRRVFKYAEKH